MSIQEVSGKKNTAGYQYPKKSGQVEGFQESLMQNLKDQEHGQEHERKAVAGEDMQTRRTEGVALMGASPAVRMASVTSTEAVQPAEVKHMRYEESDHIEIAVADGYTLKGKKAAERDKVYVEAKYEDGRLEAYQVDVTRVSARTTHKIEQFARETIESIS